MLHRSWATGDETFYLVQALNIVGGDKWKSLQQYGVEDAHALFDYDHDRDCFWLRDLSAHSSVRVNGIPISRSEPVRLKTGDRVAFGRSPEYTFIGVATNATSPIERKSASGVYSIGGGGVGGIRSSSSRRSRSSRREYSFEGGSVASGAHNGEMANLALDSAPSVNGGSHTLPRLGRGRSPASRRALSQLPIATLIDGRHIDHHGGPAANIASEDSDTNLTNGKTSAANHQSPTMLTYRQRHFMRHASVESNHRADAGARIPSSENRRRVITNAWDENRDVKYHNASSPSSSGSYADRHFANQRRASVENTNPFQRTTQSQIIRQLQKRVQQLEETLRISQPDGILLINGIVGGDSGISSAGSGGKPKSLDSGPEHHSENQRLLVREISEVEGHEDHSDDARQEQQHVHRDASDLMGELRQLREALMASEQKSMRLESLLQHQVGGPETHHAPSESLVGPASPRIIPASPRLEENENVDTVTDGVESAATVLANEAPPDAPKHKESTCHWHDFVKENQNSIEYPEPEVVVRLQGPTNVDDNAEEIGQPDCGESAEEVARVQIIKEAPSAAVGATEDGSRQQADSEGHKESMEHREDTEVSTTLAKYKDEVRALSLLQSVFADEISNWPQRVLDNPAFNYEHLTIRSIEEKKELYKLKLQQLMLQAHRKDQEGKEAFGEDKGPIEDEYLDNLCIWAVETCNSVVEATDKLMPKVVDVLKKRMCDVDAQKTLESWFKDFQIQNENRAITHERLIETAELLEVYGADYWQLDMLVSLLRFLSEKLQTPADGPAIKEINDGEVNTDISSDDFNKLISDIADLLGEKEHLQQANGDLQTRIQSNSDEVDRLKEQLAASEADSALLQIDNRNLAETRGALNRRIAQLEDQVQSLDGAPDESQHIQTLIESNLGHQARIGELEAELDLLRQKLHTFEAASNPSQSEESIPVGLETNQPTEPMTETAREELDNLKQGIAELQQNEKEENREAEHEIESPRVKMEQLESQRREMEARIADLNEKLYKKEHATSQMWQRLLELEEENLKLKSGLITAESDGKPSNGDQSDEPKEPIEEAREVHADHSEGLPTDDMFWTLSSRLSSLLDIQKQTSNQPSVDQDETSKEPQPESQKDALKAAMEITDKVQGLLERVRRQNEELLTYRSVHSGTEAPVSGEITLDSSDPPPYLAPVLSSGDSAESDGSTKAEDTAIDQKSPIPTDESRQAARGRSGSIRRPRSPSPQSFSITGSTGGGSQHNSATSHNHHGARECHACDILRARRKQHDLMQMARAQATALASRQLDTYPLKIVTFKLPSSSAPSQDGVGGGSMKLNDENR